jgi:thioredoxin reductase (NADPH)
MPDIYDVCVIGGGPAGHSAALYTSRSMLKTILFEGSTNPGGQLVQTTEVENYLGFPEGIDGYELCDKFRKQSEKWGTYIVSEYVEKIKYEDKLYSVYFDDMNQCILTKSIIVCTGSFARVLSFEGSETYRNKGITSCAVCHGALPIFRNKPLFVIGGGDTAMEDALYLSRYTDDVYIIHRRDTFRASKIMQQRVFNNNKIKILWNSEIVKAYNDNNDNNMLSMIRVKNNKTNEIKDYKASGVFYAIGHEPCTYFIRNSNININIDNDGYIMTENDSTKTNIPGIFCAGDVRQKDKKFKQAIVAAGTGCKSALECIEYLESLELLE